MTMRALSSRERKALRGFAHPLEPMLHIGKQGVTAGVLRQIDDSLEHHELIKVKFLAGKDEKAALCDTIARELGCSVAGVIGHIAILFRQNEDPEKREIEFPDLYT
jgi:RNA-binding protein